MGPDSQIALSATQRATEPSTATEASRLEAGVRAGEYIVERFLGAGAMGEVYAGKHPEIGKRVAIKVLKPALASSAEAAERFKREARVVNQIDHPNVIDVFGFGRLDDGRLYLVMDLVEGETLRAAVANGPMDIATALDVLEQIADALDAAHAKGVVHRDLKPDNVMIANGKVLVLDFGIAKLLSTGSTDSGNPSSLLTSQGAWIGTPGYMAPEQWSADGAGPASDRYALGVMAFELLSGKLPFQAPTLPQMMEQHFRAPVPALSTRGAVAARSMFDPVLACAMAKDPTTRYATAKELVAALRDASGKPARRAPGATRRLWLPASIGGGLLGIAIVAVVLARQGPTRDEGASSASPSGLVELEVRSNPPRATVLRGDRMYGTTPAKLEVRDGEQVDLTIKKPGYAPERKALAASEETRAIDVVLRQINGFEGTWVLPDGQLRAFTRSGDEHVDVFKLAALKGEKEFYRKFLFEDSHVGVKFAATETIVDQRAPSEPSCQVAVRVEYFYDAERDILQVRPEGVETGFQAGRCVVHSRELVAAISLVRADASTEVRVSHAPMTGPIDQPSLKQRQDEADGQQHLGRSAEEEKKKNLGKPVKPPARQDGRATKRPPGKEAANIDGPKRDVFEKKGAEPPPRSSPQNEAFAPPQQNAPPQQQVNGDSQVAPQVKK